MNNFSENFKDKKPTPAIKPELPQHPPKPDVPKPPEKPDKPPHIHEKPITIVVNGVDKQLPIYTESLSYQDVIRLAYGSYNEASNIIYTVAYSKGPKENPKGTLVKGQQTKVREGMIFNVSRSDKS